MSAEIIEYKNEDILAIEQTKDYFMICWHMTGWCNYHCPYCIARYLESSWTPEEMIVEYAKNINLFINEKIKPDRKIVFRLSGGEVTYYDLINVLNNIDRIDKLIVATNFSRELEYFYRLEDYCFKRNIQLVLLCSWHKQNAEFEDKFIELTNWCRQKPKQKYNYKDPQLALVVNNDFNMNKLNKIIENNNWRIRLTRLRLENQQNQSLPNNILNKVFEYNRLYDSKALASGKSFSYKITFKDKIMNFACASNFTNFLDNGGFIPDNYYCTAGIDSIAILPNGNVSLARCDYLYKNVIGNITNYKDINLPNKPIICHLNENNPNKDKRCDLCAGTRLYRNWGEGKNER